MRELAAKERKERKVGAYRCPACFEEHGTVAGLHEHFAGNRVCKAKAVGRLLCSPVLLAVSVLG